MVKLALTGLLKIEWHLFIHLKLESETLDRAILPSCCLHGHCSFSPRCVHLESLLLKLNLPLCGCFLASRPEQPPPWSYSWQVVMVTTCLLFKQSETYWSLLYKGPKLFIVQIFCLLPWSILKIILPPLKKGGYHQNPDTKQGIIKGQVPCTTSVIGLSLPTPDRRSSKRAYFLGFQKYCFWKALRKSEFTEENPIRLPFSLVSLP